MTNDEDFDGDDLLPVENEDPLAAGNAALPGIDLSDFDDEFDEDFEAEVAGEYEMDDDEFARQLVDMVDFEIEGLSGNDDAADNDGNLDLNDE